MTHYTSKPSAKIVAIALSGGMAACILVKWSGTVTGQERSFVDLGVESLFLVICLFFCVKAWTDIAVDDRYLRIRSIFGEKCMPLRDIQSVSMIRRRGRLVLHRTGKPFRVDVSFLDSEQRDALYHHLSSVHEHRVIAASPGDVNDT